MDELFQDRARCKQDDITQCISFKRIQYILTKFNTIITSAKQTEFHQIREIFSENKYTNTELLNDFHHVSYDHHLEEDHEKFALIYQSLKKRMNIQCMAKTCKHIDRYYRDRSKLSNEYILNDDADYQFKVKHQYTMELLSRIHVYFVHSYDIFNKLTLKEIAIIDQQLQSLNDIDDDKQIDDDFLEDKKTEMISAIIRKKTEKLQITRNDDKYIEGIDEKIYETKHNYIDYKAMYKLLKSNGVSIEKIQIKKAFAKYKNDQDKNTFIADIIDAYCAENEEKLPSENKIATKELPDDPQQKHIILENILYKYVKKQDLDNKNFIKISKNIINKLELNINVDEFIQIAAHPQSGINGKIFIKGTCSYKPCPKFSKLFKSVTNYKKKSFGTIYVKINQWKPVFAKSSAKKNPNFAATDEIIEIKSDEIKSNDNKSSDVYDLGKRFFYWDSHRNHPLYIQPNHKNLKTEILHNKLFEFQMKQWQSLTAECHAISKSNYAKGIVANGYHQKIYKIEPYAAFDTQHIRALKLYTDHTNLCYVFCATLRSENDINITKIANLAKLLSECVQCYGSTLKSSKQKTYYRGIGHVFMFEMFVTRFNLPTSTTIDYLKATQFGENGLVLQLRQYKYLGDVLKFDCCFLSAFPEEKETLFFGGDTILQIFTITQVINAGWVNYKKFIEPMNAVCRMINGLSIRQQRIISKIKHQRTMIHVVYCMLPAYDKNGNVRNHQLPNYIYQLLEYQISNAVIKLNYIELIEEYKWLNPILLRDYFHNLTIDMANISVLFRNSDQIIFYMHKKYILAQFECESLLEDLQQISNMHIYTYYKLNHNSCSC